MRNVVRRRPRQIEFLRIETGRHEAQGGGRVRPTANHFAWQGRLKEACVGGRPGSANRPMHVSMIRVTVTPGRVVPDQDVGVRGDPGDAIGDLIDIGASETVCVLAMQSGIAIAEPPHILNTEAGCGLQEFCAADFGETIAECRGRQPGGAVGCDNEGDMVASTDGFGHRPRGQQCLVVGMRVDEHQGLWHRSIVAYRPGVHIAHISDCYAPRTGGIETQVGGLVARQRARGDRVHVITATPGTGDEVIRLTAHTPFDLPVHPRTHHVVTQALAERDIDVVHVHVGAVSPFAWEAVRAARDLGLPTVVTVHSMWGALSRSGYGLGARLLQWPTWGVVMAAVSEAAARQVHRVTRAAVRVTPNGIDPTQWTSQGRPDMDAPLHLVSVLRLAPRKRVDALLAMFAKVHAQRPQSSLTIIGDGPLLVPARIRARALPVTLTGRLDRSRMRAVYATAHLFWQPSIRESFGIAALEARSAGVPVLARTQAGTSSFITHEVNGYLVNSDDAAVRAVVWARAEQLDAMRAHNESTEPPVTWEHVLPMVDEAYAAAQ